MKIVFTILLISMLNLSSNAQCHSELKNYAIGFDSIKANSFSFLDNELNNIQIVGYGEDTHGTAEFTILAEQLMKYLSQKHHFNVFIIETGFGEGVYLNDYIQGKRDNLKNILNNHNSTWRYRTKEFHQLINTLRVFNQNNSNKIHLYGCEMQYVISDVNRIHDFLKKVGSDYRIDGFEKHLWQGFTDYEKMNYYVSYMEIKEYFDLNKFLFTEKTSDNEFHQIYHHIEVLGQFSTAINQNNEQRKHDFRDIYMGENIQWILNFHGDESKALYWAHNAHVGDWISNGIVDVTGHQLKKLYGESYFNIATDFGIGEFIAFPHDANETNNWLHQTCSYDIASENTFTHCLKQMGKPNLFLNLRKLKTNDKLKLLIEKPLTTTSGAGAQARRYNTETNDIGRAFDGIIYINQSTIINQIE